MPFESKSQQRFMFATMPDTAERWADETSNIKELPEKKRSKTAVLLKMAADLGRMRALDKAGLLKIAGSALTAAKWGLPALAGAYVAGPEHRFEGALGGAALGHVGRKAGKYLAGRGAGFAPRTAGSGGMAWLKKNQGIDMGKLQQLASKGRVDPGVLERMLDYRKYYDPAKWGGTLAGGAGAGYTIDQFANQGNQGPSMGTRPAVSDMGTHYTGLTPGYY
jgi:hypothetical protein